MSKLEALSKKRGEIEDMLYEAAKVRQEIKPGDTILISISGINRIFMRNNLQYDADAFVVPGCADADRAIESAIEFKVVTVEPSDGLLDSYFTPSVKSNYKYVVKFAHSVNGVRTYLLLGAALGVTDAETEKHLDELMKGRIPLDGWIYDTEILCVVGRKDGQMIAKLD